ncbi:DUF6328 family protein [Nocardioides sp.]|uniref:DUF6328 family protein n=1 Tax=Nocardioides sp. TaxID=35761 RepID=UPI000C97BFBD|nr:DUF6328 family protein [Nocardioides sp.]MAS55559.1 sodium:proton antiporter [Pimelobacter sp.]MDE0777518.1 DUF6328 family protein [Nocardioides sp.]
MTAPDDPTPEQLTRNLGELLQELRVVQTGVQILTGFLLTVPFSARFEDLTGFQRTVFLVVLCGSVLTTAFVVAPVAFHRVLFRRHERRWIVEAADVTSRIGLGLLALTSAGVLLLVFDVVVGRVAGFVVLAVALACFALLWVVVPRRARS